MPSLSSGKNDEVITADNAPQFTLTTFSPTESSSSHSSTSSPSPHHYHHATTEHHSNASSDDLEIIIESEPNSRLESNPTPEVVSIPSSSSPRPRLVSSLLARRGAKSGTSNPTTPTTSPSLETASNSVSYLDNETDETDSVDSTSTVDASPVSMNVNTDERMEEVRRGGRQRSPSFSAIDALLKRRSLARRAPDQATTITSSPLSISIESHPSPPRVEGSVGMKSGEDEIRSLSIPSTPVAVSHPLQDNWTFYLQNSRTVMEAGLKLNPTEGTSPVKSKGFRQGERTRVEEVVYEAGLAVIGQASTVEKFCRYMTAIPKPSLLDMSSRLYFFRGNIRPTWEDAMNVNGGQWQITIKNDAALLDRSWTWLLFALIGGELGEYDDQINGAVLLNRPRNSRIQLWVKDSSTILSNTLLANHLIELLEIVVDGDQVKIEFKPHSVSIAQTTAMIAPMQFAALPSPTRRDAGSVASVRGVDGGGGGGKGKGGMKKPSVGSGTSSLTSRRPLSKLNPNAGVFGLSGLIGSGGESKKVIA